jgi:hypothetical protein
LGTDASIAVTKAGAKVPGLARLAKLVPILITLAELSLVSDSGDAQENLAATRNVFASLPSTSPVSDSYGGILNPSVGYPAVLRANTRPYQPMQYVQF